jgi:hypothetical protein
MRSVCLCGVLTLLACFGHGEALAQDTAAEDARPLDPLVGHKRKPHLHGVFDQPIGQWKKA